MFKFIKWLVLLYIVSKLFTQQNYELLMQAAQTRNGNFMVWIVCICILFWLYSGWVVQKITTENNKLKRQKQPIIKATYLLGEDLPEGSNLNIDLNIDKSKIKTVSIKKNIIYRNDMV